MKTNSVDLANGSDDLLEVIYNLELLIEETEDTDKVVEYIGKATAQANRKRGERQRSPNYDKVDNTSTHDRRDCRGGR